MATLLSPGVDVEITDESFYNSSGNGTVPLIVFATAENKASPTGTGIAPGTVPGTAGQLYNISSQRELIQTFGNPHFDSVQGTTVYGSELNEYGLHAAYQFLGISNSIYALRADIDLGQLQPNQSAPVGAPVNGTFWFDTADTLFGAFQSSGATNTLNPFSVKNVTVFSSTTQLDSNGYPLATLGQDGDFGIVTANAPFMMFERINTNNVSAWYPIGSKGWTLAKNILRGSAAVGAGGITVAQGDTFSINGVAVVVGTDTSAAGITTAINTAIAASNQSGLITASYDSAGRIILSYAVNMILANVVNTPLAYLNLVAGTYNSVKLTFAPHNKIPQGSTQGDVWIKTTTPNQGANYVVKQYSSTTGSWTTLTAPLYDNDADASAGIGGTVPTGSVYVQYDAAPLNNYATASFDLRYYNGSAWTDLVFEQSATAPTTAPAQGTLWFNNDFQVDIMYTDGELWHGYKNQFPNTDPNGVILSGSAPLLQTDGTSLVDQDLWIDTSDLEHYPKIYRYVAATKTWTLLNNADHTTPYGIVFADARTNSGPAYTGSGTNYNFNSVLAADMLVSNYVDPDAPDPRTYPLGTLLFNTRYSTYNVKKWEPNWFNKGGFETATDFTQTSYNVGEATVTFPPVTNAGRWVTASGNDVTGAPYMGRHAQRQMIVQALAAQFANNQQIRSEVVFFNLIACPGYVELLSEMVTLNNDCKEVAFIVGDTPARLTPDSTSISRWATNTNNVATDGDNGLVTKNRNIGLYYPWGFSTNIDGTNVVVPPSTIALYTYAFNDQIAYPWFAPAGFTRGLVSNATSVGYLDSTKNDEYVSVILNPGQRDTLYTNSINPIAYIPNRGLVVYGQKTLDPLSQATDRVNVARLCNYLQYHLDLVAKPFLFEQNDQQTRDAFRVAIERFLSGLVGLQALNDFAVVCDTSNNTPARIDANELWCDIFIQPIKSIEFIYLPVRIQNTGATH
jgi:hypothetical protein